MLLKWLYDVWICGFFSSLCGVTKKSDTENLLLSMPINKLGNVINCFYLPFGDDTKVLHHLAILFSRLHSAKLDVL